MGKFVSVFYQWALPLLTFFLITSNVLVNVYVSSNYRFLVNTSIALAVGFLSFLRLIGAEPQHKNNWGYKVLNFVYGTVNIVALLLALAAIYQNGGQLKH